MKIQLTATRCNVVIGGFAYKFARIRLLKVALDYISIRHKDSWREELREYRKRSVFNQTEHGLRYYLFHGIITNRYERAFWKRKKHPFCAQTYRSLLFGFVNIQAAPGDTVALSAEDLWNYLKEATSDVTEDKRHFSNPLNFRVENGKLIMTNYGYSGSQKIIKRRGKKLMHALTKQSV